MKPNNTIAIRPVHSYAESEFLIQKKGAELKELTRRNAKHFAKKNRPLPLALGDILLNYIGDIRHGYEELAALVLQRLQVSSHFSETKIDASFAKEKTKGLEEEIKKLQEQIDHYEYEHGEELKNFDAKSVPSRIRNALLLTGIIGIGEVLFNTKAFEVTGENLLFSLILSTGVSFAIFVLAHLTPLIYKKFKEEYKKNLTVAASFLSALAIFIALAVLRSKVLEKHNFSISPAFFVVINMFLFVVSSALSYYFFPSWEEIKRHRMLIKLHQDIENLKRKIQEIKSQIENIKTVFMEKTKERIRASKYAEDCVKRINKMYHEAVGIFKSTNIFYRNDHKVSDCFNEEVGDIQVDWETNYTIINEEEK